MFLGGGAIWGDGVMMLGCGDFVFSVIANDYIIGGFLQGYDVGLWGFGVFRHCRRLYYCWCFRHCQRLQRCQRRRLVDIAAESPIPTTIRTPTPSRCPPLQKAPVVHPHHHPHAHPFECLGAIAGQSSNALAPFVFCLSTTLLHPAAQVRGD